MSMEDKGNDHQCREDSSRDYIRENRNRIGYAIEKGGGRIFLTNQPRKGY